MNVDKDWWRGAVIYQIYPRSFQDSNGDGIGDLQGIIQRLPYVSRLGVDAIWISPIFTSPMKDFGYDIADYQDIDPMFGTLSDFDALISSAHQLGLKVMIDLVLSHTSDQHPWFKESRQDKTNGKQDWYVWADALADGSPPNNWLSIFGGPAWEWDSKRCQYYLHNFLNAQPDLNFHNKDVQTALLDTARFWLQRGVDGFRLDTINFYFCDQQLRSNPPLAEDRRNSSIAPGVNPYNYQDHLYDKNRPENLDFLRQLRAVMEEFPAIAAVGEVGDAQYGMQLMAEYTSGDDLMQMCYAFEFLSGDTLTPRYIAEVLNAFAEASSDSWSCWAFSNHDVIRHASRWNLSIAARKLFAGLILSLRGSVCLYQGEELGFTEGEVAYDQLQDPYGKQFWPEYKGRDGCRTPIPWHSQQAQGGFSEVQAWLPVDKQQTAMAASVQEDVADSVLECYRQLLTFRKKHSALIKGHLEKLKAEDQLLSFQRRDDNETLLCVFNMSDAEQTFLMPEGEWLLLWPQALTEKSSESCTLCPWQAVWFLNAK